MEDRSYSSLSRHGLASSNSLLDGVPFKIGPNFIQPPKVLAAPELSRSNLSKVLNVEYTFETEEAVLAWARAREEALKQAALEQAERLAEEQRKQVKETDGVVDVDVNDESYIISDTNESDGPNQNGGNVYDVPRNTVSSLQDHASQKEKPCVPAKLVGVKQQMPEPNTILKPTPIHSAAITDNKMSDTSSVFDVSMFESESDPFDNLELQTINDMEELKILLDSSTKSSADIISSETIVGNPQPSSDLDNNTGHDEHSASELIYDMATVVNENTWETFSNDTPVQSTSLKNNGETSDKRGKTPSPTVGCPSADGTFEQSREDGEYVEITGNYKKQTIKFQNQAVNGVSKASITESLAVKDSSSLVFGGKLSASLANSKIYKPVLLPFKPRSTDSDNSNPNTNPFSQASTQTTNPFLSHSTQDTKNPFLQNTHGHWVSFSQSSELDHDNSDLPGEQKDISLIASSVPITAPKASLLPPPPASKPSRNRQSIANSRMWSSVGPSLAASLDESINVSDSIPYNQYSRHSLSSSDLHLSSSCSDIGEMKSKPNFASQSSFQIWNRHRPLPPIPSPTPNITHTPNPIPESYKVSQLPSSQPVGLTDPYYSLSQEAQMFTNSLSSMGFLRARVARAVAKFGQDEKEVLDHLIAVDKLVEKKYAPVLVESALIIFKNDVDKAEKFLQMFTQFEELGFNSDKIQEALISTNMDYDKVLDILTT